MTVRVCVFSTQRSQAVYQESLLFTRTAEIKKKTNKKNISVSKMLSSCLSMLTKYSYVPNIFLLSPRGLMDKALGQVGPSHTRDGPTLEYCQAVPVQALSGLL